jgi:Arc/MetJ family transcription regulator
MGIAVFAPTARDRSLSDVFAGMAVFLVPLTRPASLLEDAEPRNSPGGLVNMVDGRVGEYSPQCASRVHFIHIMRTNIVIDDKLMADVLRATGLGTKREAVELGLRTLLRLRRQAELRRLRGKLAWQGDLDAMRRDR